MEKKGEGGIRNEDMSSPTTKVLVRVTIVDSTAKPHNISNAYSQIQYADI